MASYNQVSYGTNDKDSVIKLQELLNQNGYSLDVDGIFGNNTQSAVRDYQQKNGLAVDGIVGNNTWSSLTAAPADTTSTPTENNSAGTTNNAYTYEPYTPSDTVTQADTYLKEMISKKPGEYTSPWQDTLNQIIQQIQNREDFSYDLNGDALYQQYKDQYVNQGKMAMMDTMGQAAAMTGGYGNSYAQSVGQQAYQGYLQQLNDKIPELYSLALSKYNSDNQALYDQASLIAGMEDQAYGRYMDEMTNYYTELGYAQDDARYQAEQDYGRWADDRDFGYQQWLADTANSQWQQEFDFAKQQYDDSQNGGSGGDTGGSRSGDGGSDYTANPGWDEAKIKAFQQAHGLTVDGIWGPQTANAYDNDRDWAGGGIDYSGWDAGDWEGYFASIRQSEGEAAAQAELEYFTKNGLIPHNMVTYAASGARGGKMGH